MLCTGSGADSILPQFRGVDQEILTRFLRDGYFERHLNRMRGVYRMKHDLLLDLLGPFRADFRIQGELAGLHLLLESRKNTSEEELIARAWEAGVRVYGLSEYLIPAATLPKECFPPESRTILPRICRAFRGSDP